MSVIQTDNARHTAKVTTLARGVSSAARLRAKPLVLSSAHGSRVSDAQGTEYTDYVLGMGPILLGHARTEILDRVQARMRRGTLFGTVAAEFELADRLSDSLRHVERIAFVNTGSEATHMALRLARAGTGRRLVVKFEGHYHGWIDPLFANTQNNQSASPELFPVPSQHSVQGQQPSDEVIVIRWNSIPELQRVFAEFAGQIAGVIVEPIPMNFGTMLPDPAFARELREITRREGTVLIFDEVLSGFRLALGGAAEVIGVEPDLAVYAKAIANGFPLAAVGGTVEAMRPITEGPMLPAGTYSGNPMSIEASLATLDLLTGAESDIYSRLESLGDRLAAGIRQVAAGTGAPISVHQVGSVLQLFWGVDEPVKSYADADRSDRAMIARLSEAQLDHGHLVSGRGLMLLSAAHTLSDIDSLIEGIERTAAAL